MNRAFVRNNTALVILLIIMVCLYIFLVSKNNTDTYKPDQTQVVQPTKQDSPQDIEATTTPTVVTKPLSNYIEIINACGPSMTGLCVNMRSGPGTENKVVERLRNGVVLEISDILASATGTWYKVKVDTSLQFPERVGKSGWFISSGDSVELFKNIGTENISTTTKPTTKRIIVDLSEQKLYAYDGDVLFMKEAVSTGLKDTPTPRGIFKVFKKTPSRYMQGPIDGVSDQYYDLPGVPWDLYFTAEGAVIHGAYWHDSFGQRWSHGCVNLSPENAKKLYLWADLGIPVIVQN